MKKLSVIDDDVLQHRIIGLLAKRADLLVTESFYEGLSAINHFKAKLNQPDELPDIILLDINMPLMNGWEFLKSFEPLVPQLSKPIAVYVVSSSIDPVEKSKALSYSFVIDYLRKPIPTDFLKNLEKK